MKRFDRSTWCRLCGVLARATYPLSRCAPPDALFASTASCLHARRRRPASANTRQPCEQNSHWETPSHERTACPRPCLPHRGTAVSPFEAAIRAQWNDFEHRAQSGLALELVTLDLPALEETFRFRRHGCRRVRSCLRRHRLDCLHARARVCRRSCAAARTRAAAGLSHGWSPSLLRLQQVEEAVLGVPYHDGPECLIYRRDLFDDPQLHRQFLTRFGRPLAPPATWSEFYETAGFLHRPEEHFYGAVFAALPDGHNSVYDFMLQLWSRCGEFSPQRVYPVLRHPLPKPTSPGIEPCSPTPPRCIRSASPLTPSLQACASLRAKSRFDD